MIEESSRTIDMLNTGYTICLVLSIVFFLISVLLFFIFDIKRVFLIKTGKAARKEIKKLQEENFNTGRLKRYQASHTYGESGSIGKSEEIAKTEQMGKGYAGNQQLPTQPDSNVDSTSLLGQNDTALLNESTNQTTVLNIGATTVLNAGMQRTVNIDRKFEIVKNEMFIHTQEVI